MEKESPKGVIGILRALCWYDANTLLFRERQYGFPSCIDELHLLFSLTGFDRFDCPDGFQDGLFRRHVRARHHGRHTGIENK